MGLYRNTALSRNPLYPTDLRSRSPQHPVIKSPVARASRRELRLSLFEPVRECWLLVLEGRREPRFRTKSIARMPRGRGPPPNALWAASRKQCWDSRKLILALLTQEWIQEAADQANACGSKAGQTLNRAAKAIKRCPDKMVHPVEAQQLSGVGPKVVEIITRKLQQWCDEHNQQMPLLPQRRTFGGPFGSATATADSYEMQLQLQKARKEHRMVLSQRRRRRPRRGHERAGDVLRSHRAVPRHPRRTKTLQARQGNAQEALLSPRPARTRPTFQIPDRGAGASSSDCTSSARNRRRKSFARKRRSSRSRRSTATARTPTKRLGRPGQGRTSRLGKVSIRSSIRHMSSRPTLALKLLP